MCRPKMFDFLAGDSLKATELVTLDSAVINTSCNGQLKVVDDLPANRLFGKGSHSIWWPFMRYYLSHNRGTVHSQNP